MGVAFLPLRTQRRGFYGARRLAPIFGVADDLMVGSERFIDLRRQGIQ